MVSDLAAGLTDARWSREARSVEFKEREAELHRWIATCHARYPRVRIATAPVLGMGNNALLLAARRADLLVLDATHPSGKPRDRCADQAAMLRLVSCPVVFVPPQAHMGRSYGVVPGWTGISR